MATAEDEVKRWKAIAIRAAIAAFFLGWPAGFGIQFGMRAAFNQLHRPCREQTLVKYVGSEIPLEVLDEIHKWGKVPVADVMALIEAESSGNPRAKSPAGALGLGQIMPGVAAQYGFAVDDLFVPWVNVFCTVRHYSAMLEIFAKTENPEMNAISAYNCGPTEWKRILNAKPRRAPPDETQRMWREFQKNRKRYHAWLRRGTGIE